MQPGLYVCSFFYNVTFFWAATIVFSHSASCNIDTLRTLFVYTNLTVNSFDRLDDTTFLSVRSFVCFKTTLFVEEDAV